MAITKIQCLNEAHTGNPASHLKNALSYIQNPEKTEENVLVGSINCLPDTAFEQMMDTKVTFGKTNKRQGYHIIISFAPGEATEEQALDIVARFAQEYLKDKYEAVYAVHNDKKHMHGHIVFNSVSFETGMKHECKKGEWKHRMQPITNRLCKEYALSIVPAEYVKEPKNLSRKEWEREQCFRKMILTDAEFCQSQAGSFDHFIFLMKRIGYQFEYGKYLSVKVPGGKWYHELDKLDERFSEEKFRFYLDMPFTRPVFVVGNTVAIHKRGITDFQIKYYRRIYQARMVEQRRFDKHSAYLARELERICSNYNRNGKDACSRHCIREEDLNQIVLGELQGYINSMCDCEKVLAHLDELNVNYDEAVAHDKEIVARKQELTKCSAFKASLYQDLRDEIISKEQFTRYREEFSAKERELEQAIREQETIIRDIYENGIAVAKDLEQFREGLVIGNLDRVALVSFIDRILIYDDFRVEIVFKYRQEMEKVTGLFDVANEKNAEPVYTMVDGLPVLELKEAV